MSHHSECRHKTADCNCEALELRADLEDFKGVFEREMQVMADQRNALADALALARDEWRRGAYLKRATTKLMDAALAKVTR